MKTNEFKAVLESTVEFAAFRQRDITEIGDQYKYNQGRNLRSCPEGLKKVKVVGVGQVWEEPFTLGCGDQVHMKKRRNGIRIEFPLPATAPKGARTAGGRQQTALGYWRGKQTSEIVKRDDKTFVTILVNASAIIAPWGEYEMIEAQRDKARKKHAARKARKDAAAEALGVKSWWQSHHDVTEMGAPYKRKDGEDYYDHEVDCIVIPIGLVEKLVEQLAAAQK